jgi:hypothetical protein
MVVPMLVLVLRRSVIAGGGRRSGAHRVLTQRGEPRAPEAPLSPVVRCWSSGRTATPPPPMCSTRGTCPAADRVGSDARTEWLCCSGDLRRASWLGVRRRAVTR